MGKHSATGWWVPLTKRWILALLIMLSISTAIAFFIRAALDPCDRHLEVSDKKRVQSQSVPRIATKSSPLSFMKSKLVLLVSHELSLSGIFFFNFTSQFSRAGCISAAVCSIEVITD